MQNIKITFPDGNNKEFASGVTGLDIAKSIAASLAKNALAIKIDGHLQDLSLPITQDAAISIVTPKDKDALEIIRHDAAHIMAEAVKELYPETQVTIGPAIENGFYYDFSRTTPFTPDDLVKIEQRMYEIVKRNEAITREVWQRDEAVKFFQDSGEKYKAEIISAIPSDEPISLYRQGNFIDLCRGPHAPSTGHIKFFKLMKLAGAYWRGDSKNEMLQRIYGTAWESKESLDNYLQLLEEAAKRDHRKLGREMSLFHIQEEAVGSIFWHPQGWMLYRQIENYIREKISNNGYVEVRTPQLLDKILWEKSGHWEKFGHNMFTCDSEERTLALKPMNCPGHVQIFNQELKSYRQLPLRMAEFGSCHRNEPSGALHGIMRVRNFIQDDAHIFCEESQVNEETVRFCEMLKEVYRDFGFHKVKVKFSDRPAVRAGTDEIWDKAENALKQAVAAANLQYELNPGEGAFYGPKLEFVLVDALNRDWQCGTLQVDFILPERLDASYIAADGSRKRPVMLHRAIVGSLERFIGILIENFAGKFPLWLAPTQIVIASITNDFDEYGEKVAKILRAQGFRVVTDFTAEKINYKIRLHSLKKVPLILAVGAKEKENNSVAVRKLGEQNQSVQSLDQFINWATQKVANKEAL